MPKYIDVDMLKKRLEKAYPRFLRRFLNPVVLVLENMPCANVRPVNHGTWRRMFNSPYALFNLDTARASDIQCSCCGSVFDIQLEIGYERKYNYCPCCGAKMDADK